MLSTIDKIVIDILSAPMFSYFGRSLFGRGVPIFLIHRVQNQADELRSSAAISTDYLRKCLEYLVERKFTFISLFELISCLNNKEELPAKCVVFTMDDGFEDQLSLAAPVFEEYNCPVTLFLITGMIDQKTWPWDDKVSYLINHTQKEELEIDLNGDTYRFPLITRENKIHARKTLQVELKACPLSELNDMLSQLEFKTDVKLPVLPPPEYTPVSWQLAREFEGRGVDFAPHTTSHYILSKLDSKIMKTEILDSWQRLKEELVSPKPIFCYPTGRYCDFGWREVKLLQDSGFIGAVSTIPAQIRQELINQYYMYSLPRFVLPNSFHEFKMYCDWIEYSKESNLRFWPQ